MVFAARLTQQGHKIATMEDLMVLYEKAFSENTVATMAALPHPTIQKFAVITVAVVGANRRFLALITRHQNEVKFMSASLQYSNYTGQADFAVPYEVMTAPSEVLERYLKSCHESMKCYEMLCAVGTGHDAAGYVAPQGLRNVLIISATPYQWKHIIGQWGCAAFLGAFPPSPAQMSGYSMTFTLNLCSAKKALPGCWHKRRKNGAKKTPLPA